MTGQRNAAQAAAEHHHPAGDTLQPVEQQVRRMNAVCAISLVVGVTALVVMADLQELVDLLRGRPLRAVATRSLTLVDDAGELAWLGAVASSGPVMTLVSRRRRSCIVLGAPHSGDDRFAGLGVSEFCGEEGVGRAVSVGLNESASTVLALEDSFPRPRVIIKSENDGQSSLSLLDSDEHISFGVSTRRRSTLKVRERSAAAQAAPARGLDQ